MTARNDTLRTEPGKWLLITDGAVDALTVQNQGDVVLWLQGVPLGAPKPVNRNGAAKFIPGTGSEGMNLADFFLGISNPESAYVMAEDFACDVMVSHA